MYRSFVTCDDPKGVVECKTIRKSKTGSQKSEGKVENCKMPKNLNHSSTNKEERKEIIISKGIAEESHNPSSFQIMEVSKGAEKLNRVIDSWSMGMKFDSRSKDVAKDLLKGALDLQESLVMLGKLQEASHYMAKLKKKPKGKSLEGKFDDVGSESTASNRFGNRNYQMGFQEQRLSVDRSSKDCYEELREVIRDSLSRQNMLPKSYIKEKGYCDGDFPSTSSSQSPMTQSHSFAFSDCSPSSRAPHLKSSGPNLIAKLMGLEGAPVESDKISNQRRPLFEFDMPKRIKPHSVVQKANPERSTLKEILETLQFKGLLRSNSLEGFKSPSHHPSDFCSEKRTIDDDTPIVVIKPMRYSLQESEEDRIRMFRGEERALDTIEKLRKFKIKEELGHKVVKDCKELLAKREGKEIKTKEKLSSKIKASADVNHKAEKKEEIQKKVEKIQKEKSNRRKPVETENVKSKGTSGSLVHAKVVAPKLHNPKKVSKITKNRITQEKSTASSPISRRTTPTISHVSTDQKKKSRNGKAVKKPVAANLAAEKTECKYDTKGINTVVENECDMTRTNGTSAEQVFNEEEADAPTLHVKEHCNENHHSTSEVKQQTTQHESNTKSGEEEANYCIDKDITEKIFFKAKPNQKDVLLSSSSFLDRANELFDINSNQPILCVNDSEEADTRLLLDCANELMELKSLQCRGTSHPFSHTSIGGSRICISLDQLAAEICNGIEKLGSYNKLSSESLSIDKLFGVLERDLWCKGMVSGRWDLGWKNGFSLDEVEQVVGDLEKLVLNSLLEEVLACIV